MSYYESLVYLGIYDDSHPWLDELFDECVDEVRATGMIEESFGEDPFGEDIYLAANAKFKERIQIFATTLKFIQRKITRLR